MAANALMRRSITIKGIVQGVGFRPFVHSLARRHGLKGFVRNDGAAVRIEVEGRNDALERFTRDLKRTPPPLAVVDDFAWQDAAPVGAGAFCIEPSKNAREQDVYFSPDLAVCSDCLREMRDPANRRYRYPFLNCAHCGPRLTIVKQTPYDRATTTMSEFKMCAACQAEYDDPDDRRFHAQPTACPACGPSLQVSRGGKTVETPDAVAYAARMILAGEICALKGLGGFHLVCDARNTDAVRALRSRKQRDEKPFAIMAADADEATRLCEVSEPERDLLQSSARPIVLLRKRAAECLAGEIAFANPWLGILLPYTPLHYLLMDACRTPLVMTSGNRSDEPIAFRDDDAFRDLAGIADFFLAHNRAIRLRCDDSVARISGHEPEMLRRSRGYVPAPLRVPVEAERPILALGGQLKNVFALGRGSRVFLSHHIGDLDHYEAYRAYGDAIEHFQELFQTVPGVLAHDLHPGYLSTQYARERGGARVAVQHHHAHMAACMAENGLKEPVIGVIFDGAGLGTDDKIWGGEFLTGDYRGFERFAHFRYVAMPGGEQAIREPWRMAAAQVLDCGRDLSCLQSRVPERELKTVAQLVRSRFNTPETSSCGRLFDAVAALLGVHERVSYEGQAAIELEWLATDVPPRKGYAFEFNAAAQPRIIDSRPAISAILDDRGRVEPRIIARRWHSTLVEIVCEVCSAARSVTGLRAVVLSGGVFLNLILLRESVQELSARGFRVYSHHRVPTNDGGLALGQWAVAAAREKAD